MTWLPQSAPGRTAFDRVFGLCSELQADYAAFADLLWTRSGVDPVLLELCRVRIEQILGCATPSGDSRQGRAAVAPERIAALEDWRTDRRFSALERACLELAEKFVLDPRGVSDADVAALTAHLSAAQTVALIEALAVFDGFARFRAILDADGAD